MLANCVSPAHSIASYIPDDEQGQYDATRALIAKGYRAPLCIHLPADTLAAGLRRRGLERAWREAGRDVEQLRQYHLELSGGDQSYQTASRCWSGISLQEGAIAMSWCAGTIG